VNPVASGQRASAAAVAELPSREDRGGVAQRAAGGCGNRVVRLVRAAEARRAAGGLERFIQSAGGAASGGAGDLASALAAVRAGDVIRSRRRVRLWHSERGWTGTRRRAAGCG